MKHDQFIQAIKERRIVSLTFYSKEDSSNQIRRCAVLDYGIRRGIKSQEEHYHFWDFDGKNGIPHTLSLTIDKIVDMKFLNEIFEPSSFITWKPNWHISRDWGTYS